ncbi:TetR family transcriptional regulator [Rhodococcus sp. H36-A4]|uniref:TetR/AcrR family transcriptional regulator n=1 Tax=Rhodococcus sp. H36-A4 TaxID=3004353 RepID=UPI0022B04F4C|nr:TetR/AcrR family transcriptional regulator [Rhodococcus sp. H36-A4]MCZ4079925.1 TetR family transcriptional regulator [Rhodococcus sp. H36-A4]
MIRTRPVARVRDSDRTKQDLLEAATELFGARGYERTTIREIGEKAGADPALIARYFGSKAALYIQTLPTENENPHLSDMLDPARIEATIRRVHQVGPSPVLQAVVRAHDDPAIQTAATARIDAKLTAGIQDRMKEAGLDSPRLRAQMAVAVLAGIALGRAAGTLDELAGAEENQVVQLTVRLLESLLDENRLSPDHPSPSGL